MAIGRQFGFVLALFVLPLLWLASGGTAQAYTIRCGKCCICPSCCSSGPVERDIKPYQPPTRNLPRTPRRERRLEIDRTTQIILRAHRIGAAHHRAGRWTAALAAYQKALAYCDTSQSCRIIRGNIADVRAGQYNDIGNRRFELRDWTAAISAYHVALEHCGSSFRALEMCAIVHGNLRLARNSHQAKLQRKRRISRRHSAQKRAFEFQKKNRWGPAVSAWSKARANCDRVVQCQILERSLARARAGFSNQRGLKHLRDGSWIDAVVEFEESRRLCLEGNFPAEDCKIAQANLDLARKELTFAKDLPARQRGLSDARQQIAAILGTLDRTPTLDEKCTSREALCFQYGTGTSPTDWRSFDVSVLQATRDSTSREFTEENSELIEKLKSSGAGAFGKTLGFLIQDVGIRVAVQLAVKLVEAGRQTLGVRQKRRLIVEGQNGLLAVDEVIVDLQLKKYNAFKNFSGLTGRAEFTAKEIAKLRNIMALYDYDILILRQTKREIEKRMQDIEKDIGKAKAQ